LGTIPAIEEQDKTTVYSAVEVLASENIPTVQVTDERNENPGNSAVESLASVSE